MLDGLLLHRDAMSSFTPVSSPAPTTVLSSIKVSNTPAATLDARVEELRAAGQIVFNKPKG
jgi:hypothetical protein